MVVLDSNFSENRLFCVSGGLSAQGVYKARPQHSSEWLRSCPATSAGLPHCCLLPGPYRLIRIPEKYQEASVQAAFLKAVWAGSPGLGREQSPGVSQSSSLHTLLWLWAPAPQSCLCFWQSQSPIPPSRLFSACWALWRLDSLSFRVGACNLPLITSGKQCFPVAGHQIVSLWVKHSQSL